MMDHPKDLNMLPPIIFAIQIGSLQCLEYLLNHPDVNVNCFYKKRIMKDDIPNPFEYEHIQTIFNSSKMKFINGLHKNDKEKIEHWNYLESLLEEKLKEKARMVSGGIPAPREGKDDRGDKKQYLQHEQREQQNISSDPLLYAFSLVSAESPDQHPERELSAPPRLGQNQ